MDELTCMDYLTQPLTRLIPHASFSWSAMQKAIDLSKLTTTQLEHTDLPELYG